MASFQQVQTQFAEHIRNPEQVNGPAGIEDRRLHIYRELFYNNIEGFISGAFPVLRSLINDDAWHTLIRDFMVGYRCQTPYFLEISQEFQHYLSSAPSLLESEQYPAFIHELAHYEWVELALDISTEDIDSIDDVDAEADMLTRLPVVSPLAWSLAYQYPVHLIGADFQPEVIPEQPSYLVVYRNRQDSVGFMEANAVTARLLALLNDEVYATGREVLLALAAEMQHPNPEQIVSSGLDIFKQLLSLDILLGAK